MSQNNKKKEKQEPPPPTYKSSVAQKLEGSRKLESLKTQEQKVFQPNVNVPRRIVGVSSNGGNLDEKLPKELLVGQNKDRKPNFKPNAPKQRRTQSFSSFQDYPQFMEPPVEHNMNEDSKKKTQKIEEVIEKEDFFEGVKMPPTMLPLKKNETNEDEIFQESEIMTGDELFFIQLPSVLPLSQSKQTQKSQQVVHGAEFDDIWINDFKNTLTDLPKGHIGEMMIYKSGKMKLKLGGIYLDVLAGTNRSFLENVMTINPDTKQTHILGDISKRILCVPDIDYLLKQKD